MKITVIINTYPRSERKLDLTRLLKSLADQTFKEFDIVIVENSNSNVEVEEILYQLKLPETVKIKVLKDETKRLSYLFNVGWQACESEYVAFIADDAEASVEWLEAIIKELDNDLEVGVVTGPVPSQCFPAGEMHRLYLHSQKNHLTKFIARPYLSLVMENNVLKPGNFFESGAYSIGTALPESVSFPRQEIDLATTTNMGTRKSLLKKLNGFDESFNFNHADGDLFVRVKRLDLKIIYNPKIIVKHYLRIGPSRNSYFIGYDTGVFYKKNVKPKSLRGRIGCLMNVLVLNFYWIYSYIRNKDLKQLRGITGFLKGYYFNTLSR